MDGDSFATLTALIILLILSALFATAETAFATLSRIRIKNMMENKNKRAALVYRLIQDYDKLISTISVGNNLVSIMAASIATVFFVQIYGDAGITISTIIVTAAILLFGEITPKSLAKKSPEKFAMLLAPLVRFLNVAFTPINFLFSLWQRMISAVYKGTADQTITEDELLTMIDEAEQEGAIDESDSELIHNAIEFNDQLVDDILTPRVDIVGITKQNTEAEISRNFTESGYSRIPVFDGSIDQIIGVIHLRDFFEHVIQGKNGIEDIIKPVIFVTPYMKISDLFARFQKTKSHFAVVADEYGGTLGIVTMEDILEELVGEIWDEHDEIVEDFTRLEDGTYQVAASASIDKMFELFDLTGEADSTTVSGWIMEQLGRIPEDGDSFEYENIVVTVTKTDHRRVVECIVRVKAEE